MGVEELRAAVIGANKTNSGLGLYIVQKFHKLSRVDLVAFSCRTEESARYANTAFREHGIDATPYYTHNGSPEDSIDAMLTEKRPDIVAICTPNRTHLDYLELVLDHNDTSDRKTHVLLEKPLAESSPEHIERDLDRAIELVERAEKQDIVLTYNASLAALVDPYKGKVGDLDDNQFTVAMHMKHKGGELPSPRTLQYSILSHTIGILQAYFGPNMGIENLERKTTEPTGDDNAVGAYHKFTLTYGGWKSVPCIIDLSKSPELAKHERYFGVKDNYAHIEKKDGFWHLVFKDEERKVEDFQDTVIANMVDVVRTEPNRRGVLDHPKPILDGRAMIMNQVILHTLMGDLTPEKAEQYQRKLYN